MPIPEVMRMLREMEDLHERKNQDYAGDRGDFYNFNVAAWLAGQFDDPMDKVFTTLIGIKLGRLAVLLNSGKNPNNESVEDTMRDLPMYCVLWAARRERMTGSSYDQTKSPASESSTNQVNTARDSNSRENEQYKRRNK